MKSIYLILLTATFFQSSFSQKPYYINTTDNNFQTSKSWFGTYRSLQTDFVVTSLYDVSLVITRMYYIIKETKQFNNNLLSNINEGYGNNYYNDYVTTSATNFIKKNSFVVRKLNDFNLFNFHNKTQKKIFYLLLIITVSVLIHIWVIKKKSTHHSSIHPTDMNVTEHRSKEKIELILSARESELKEILLNNYMSQELLSKTTREITKILQICNENEVNMALRSLKASLLSENGNAEATIELQHFLNDVCLDFKIKLENQFPELNSKEKELLCLMSLGLKTPQISNLKNTSISAIKSMRHRIRKKIGVDSNDDIIKVIKAS
ncbi:helix-turn-helix transcriptional regulator [Jejuia spongiicola]|uniref:HTH luxR-type domain-containing protein n=1 Tax=Jejuia spongiicola TaxID=2942207 RepID=A0ABT0QL94_9FLAO|nr:hypothetical protein [Jejuia spongiicola]MCL6296725.1 hypothetical protein [Jejuia spongiicola]